MDAYFKALGGGSRDEMAEPPKDDDDVTFEKQSEVVKIYLNAKKELLSHSKNDNSHLLCREL